MRIKKGDKVQVITGAYKGTVAEVIKTFPKDDKVIVEGVNLVKKHMKPTQMNPEGGIIEKEAPIHVSNVMAYDAKAKTASRIGMTEEKGNKVRVYKKTGAAVK
ncbi:MAG: 50S ribosomal protein L24 [Erysipelotrichaceae bacterium]